jgi:hypothetical protein
MPCELLGGNQYAVFVPLDGNDPTLDLTPPAEIARQRGTDLECGIEPITEVSRLDNHRAISR